MLIKVGMKNNKNGDHAFFILRQMLITHPFPSAGKLHSQKKVEKQPFFYRIKLESVTIKLCKKPKHKIESVKNNC